MEIYRPTIFDGHSIVAGMSMRGGTTDFPPFGFSFKHVPTISNDQFALHETALNKTIGKGIGKHIISLQQEHGAHIISADAANDVHGDGLYTKRRDVTIAVSLADCCGILIFDPVQQVMMALHSGWRGTRSEIGQKGVELLKHTYQSNPEDLLIWLTPCAGRDVYQVGDEFREYFPSHVHKSDEGTHILDLKGAIIDGLLSKGVVKHNMEISDVCTIQDARFHSYRRDGDLGRNMAFMTFAG